MRNTDPLPGLLATSNKMCQHWVTWPRDQFLYLLEPSHASSSDLNCVRRMSGIMVLCSAFLPLLCFSLIKFRLLRSSKYCIFLRNIIVLEQVQYLLESVLPGFLLAWYSEIFFFFLLWFKITCLTCWFIACHVRLFPLGCIFLRWSDVFLKNVLLLPWNIKW